jgi:arylsulfatase
VGHVVDFLPTILELAGGKPGEKWNGLDVPPLPGKSLVPAFAKDRAVERDYVFFHHSGNRALRMGDWKIVSANDNQNTWELYDLAADRSETTNLADKQPDRVRQMSARWQALEDDFRQQAGVGVPKEETPAKPKPKAKSKAGKTQPE